MITRVGCSPSEERFTGIEGPAEIGALAAHELAARDYDRGTGPRQSGPAR